MPQVTVTLNGRTYRLECGEGEEQHLLALAGEMGRHVEQLKTRFGQVGDDRLLLMAGLMIADELAETRSKLEEVTGALAQIERDAAAADDRLEAAQAQMANKIAAAADRIQALSAEINRAGGRDGGE